MSSSNRIYLDHAATSFPKPAAVGRAMLHCLEELGVSPGRSATRRGSEVQRTIDRCRQRIATLFGAEAASYVIFTLNGTDSLHLAINGLLRAGDRVVTTVWEHNSVLRPLHEAAESRQVSLTIVPHDGQGRTDLNAFRDALRKSAPRLVVLNHVSNVTGIIQPVEEMARLAKEAGAFVILDAAQSAGMIPVSLNSIAADIIACPGHKGLQGPLGTGLLILRSGIEKELRPVRLGGTGTRSESLSQPLSLPDRYESGNLNAPGIYGLEAALAQLSAPTEVPRFPLMEELISGLQSLPGVEVMIPDLTLPRVPVVSIHHHRIESQVLATLLDEHYGIEVRAGLHCAPLAHQALGTLESGGTVRFSLGETTSAGDIDQTLAALAEINAAL